MIETESKLKSLKICIVFSRFDIIQLMCMCKYVFCKVCVKRFVSLKQAVQCYVEDVECGRLKRMKRA